MSNSRKKTPICGYTTAESEKQDKRLANRCYRRTVRQQLGLVMQGEDDTSVITTIRAVSNRWSFDKDGKQFLHDPDVRDMRK